MTPQSLLRRSAYAGAAIGASALVWGTLERRSRQDGAELFLCQAKELATLPQAHPGN